MGTLVGVRGWAEACFVGAMWEWGKEEETRTPTRVPALRPYGMEGQGRRDEDAHKGPRPTSTPPASLRIGWRIEVCDWDEDAHKGPRPTSTPPASLRMDD